MNKKILKWIGGPLLLFWPGVGLLSLVMTVNWPLYVLCWQVGWLGGLLLFTTTMNRKYERMKQAGFAGMRDSSVLGDCEVCGDKNVSTISLHNINNEDDKKTVCIACATGKKTGHGLHFGGIERIPPGESHE